MLSNKQNISNIVNKPMNWRLGNNISTVSEKIPGTIYVDVENASENIPAKMYIDISDSLRLPIGVYNTLPNPNTLVISQANDADKITYDGSAAKELNITPDSVGALATSGGTMTGPVTTKGIRLTKDVDYGDTLPETLMEGQLSFQTASNLVLDLVYPIGSIYMSVNATSPSTLFGGTWEQIQGKFLLGMSSSYPAGSQGGEAEHTLTSSQLPDHVHYLRQWGNTNRMLPSNYATDDPSQEFFTTEVTAPTPRYLKPTAGDYLIAGELADTPHGRPHNNMPPYLSVYIWKRTA